MFTHTKTAAHGNCFITVAMCSGAISTSPVAEWEPGFWLIGYAPWRVSHIKFGVERLQTNVPLIYRSTEWYFPNHGLASRLTFL